MAKKEQEPQYIMSPLNTPMLNYKAYYMNKKEKIITFFIAFIVGGVAGLAFYGGQFKDEDGLSTTATFIYDIILFCVIGIVANIIYTPMRKKKLKQKRKTELTKQFRSFLEAIAVSLSSGMNISDSLNGTYNDLVTEYSEDAYIVAEVKEMIEGMQNNIPIEDMIDSFGERSEIDDIKNFSMVFGVAYKAGGNIKDIVKKTNNIISEKIEITNEIETALTSNKSQFSAMMCIPVVMMLLLRLMSTTFSSSFATIPGIVAMSIAIVIFIISYKLGQKIMDIKG